MAVSGYGDCVAALVPNGDMGSHGDGWKGDGPMCSGLSGAGPRCDGEDGGSGNDALCGVWRAGRTGWPLTPGDGIAATPM